eukprot:4098273-Ditylum_brightwellii.AAC.1
MSPSLALAAAATATRRIISSSTAASGKRPFLQNVETRGMVAMRSFSSQGPGGDGPGGRGGR